MRTSRKDVWAIVTVAARSACVVCTLGRPPRFPPCGAPLRLGEMSSRRGWASGVPSTATPRHLNTAPEMRWHCLQELSQVRCQRDNIENALSLAHKVRRRSANPSVLQPQPDASPLWRDRAALYLRRAATGSGMMMCHGGPPMW